MNGDVEVEGLLSDLPGQPREGHVTRIEHARLQFANEGSSAETRKVPERHGETRPALDQFFQPGVGLDRAVEPPGQCPLAQKDRPEVVAEKDEGADSQIGEERFQSLQVVSILSQRPFQHQGLGCTGLPSCHQNPKRGEGSVLPQLHTLQPRPAPAVLLRSEQEQTYPSSWSLDLSGGSRFRYAPRPAMKMNSQIARSVRSRMVWAGLQRKARSQGVGFPDLQRVRSFLGVGEKVSSRHPTQLPTHYFPELESKPWYEAEEFEWTQRLSDGFEDIRRELGSLLGDEFQRHPSYLGEGGQWKVFYLHYTGRKVEPNCRRCPRTTELIESIPGHRAGMAYFSRLAPGGHITAHSGPANTGLRCHLGLRIPPDCRIRVSDEVRSWENGKCLVFDDSFEHEVWSRSAQSRYVLIVDFFHPDLSEAEKWALREIMKMSWLARWRFKKLARPAVGLITSTGRSH